MSCVDVCIPCIFVADVSVWRRQKKKKRMLNSKTKPVELFLLRFMLFFIGRKLHRNSGFPVSAETGQKQALLLSIYNKENKNKILISSWSNQIAAEKTRASSWLLSKTCKTNYINFKILSAFFHSSFFVCGDVYFTRRQGSMCKFIMRCTTITWG